MKTYIPFIIPALAALLAYFYGKRTNKLNLFYNQVNTNLSEVCEPLYFDLKTIINIKNIEIRYKKLDEFFNDNLIIKGKLHMLGNRQLIEEYLEVEELFNSSSFFDFQKVVNLYVLVEKEYWKNFNSLYYDFKWFQRYSSGNFVVSIIFWTLKYTMELVTSFIGLIIIILYFYSYEFFVVKFLSVKSFMNNDFLEIILLTLPLLITTYGFLMMIYPSNLKQKSKYKRKKKYKFLK